MNRNEIIADTMAQNNNTTAPAVPKPTREMAMVQGSTVASIFRTPKRYRTPSEQGDTDTAMKPEQDISGKGNDIGGMGYQDPVIRARIDAHLVMQPMLTTTILQCKSCSMESRDRFAPAQLAKGKVLLHLVLCPTCMSANKKIRSISNYDIMPRTKTNYTITQKAKTVEK